MRNAAKLLIAAFSLALLSDISLAQSGYPNHVVKIIVPTSPGAVTDVLARAIGRSCFHDVSIPIVNFGLARVRHFRKHFLQARLAVKIVIALGESGVGFAHVVQARIGILAPTLVAHPAFQHRTTLANIYYGDVFIGRLGENLRGRRG